ncbi:hypothetical protein HDU78_000403 [Chytriomyces hyalinus]|nr:hypothetical protein HDU78_000403 [Chytriomyces hyalinus]
MVTALQESATDPKTGRLDLDILQTGISNRDRNLRHDLKRTVQEFLENLNTPSVRFNVAYAQFREQTKVVTEDEFFKVVKEIGNDDTSSVMVTGRSKMDAVIRRKN